MKKKILLTVLTICMMITSFTGCEYLDSQMDSLKGTLVGNAFDISIYDNFGNNVVNIDGSKVSVEGNEIKVKGVDSDGSSTTEYQLSSVISNTIDGNNMEQTGNTVVYAEKGLNKIEDFELPKDIQTTDNGNITLMDRNINHIKNLIGTSKIVVISSQLGVPISVYGGNSVYWEIPSDLPKMTKLSIDGKALYIHRANYIILDTEMIK